MFTVRPPYARTIRGCNKELLLCYQYYSYSTGHRKRYRNDRQGWDLPENCKIGSRCLVKLVSSAHPFQAGPAPMYDALNTYQYSTVSSIRYGLVSHEGTKGSCFDDIVLCLCVLCILDRCSIPRGILEVQKQEHSSTIGVRSERTSNTGRLDHLLLNCCYHRQYCYLLILPMQLQGAADSSPACCRTTYYEGAATHARI